MIVQLHSDGVDIRYIGSSLPAVAPLAFPSTMAFAVVETHLYLDISGFGWISVVGFCPCVSGFGLCIDRCYASSQTENAMMGLSPLAVKESTIL